MREWKFWEWVAYSAIFIAALLLAVDTGLRMSPTLMTELPTGFLHSPWWGFAPLGLLLIATTVFLKRAFGWIGNDDKKSSIQKLHWPNPYTPISVVGKKIANERVPVDGHSYYKCDFTNVTLVYNGTTPIQMANCDFHGVTLFHSDSQPVLGTLVLLYGMGAMRPDFKIDFGPQNVVTPISPLDTAHK